MGPKGKKKENDCKESHEILIAQESDKMIEQDKIIKKQKFPQKIMVLFFR